MEGNVMGVKSPRTSWLCHEGRRESKFTKLFKKLEAGMFRSQSCILSLGMFQVPEQIRRRLAKNWEPSPKCWISWSLVTQFEQSAITSSALRVIAQT